VHVIAPTKNTSIGLGPNLTGWSSKDVPSSVIVWSDPVLPLKANPFWANHFISHSVWLI
jgi:hypothetical protein